MAALIYAFGIGTLFAGDLIVANLFDSRDIADWALFRALLGISAVLPLTGLDQVLVRSPQSSERLMGRLLLQIPLAGFTVGLALEILGILDHWALGSGLAIGSAFSLMLFQYFRSHRHRVLSQLAQQGWKIGAFGLLVYFSAVDIKPDLIFCGVILLFVANAVAGFFVFRHPPSSQMTQTPESMVDLYAIGLRFMVTGLFLSFSVYAEQIVVNRLGSVEEAALYFTSAIYFLFPMSFLNGYAAFLIGPWIRDNEQKFLFTLWLRRFHLMFGVVFYALFVSGVGWVAWIATSPSVGPPDHNLQALIFFICIFRTLYLFPSGYIGILGRPNQHDALIVAQVLTFIVVVFVFIGLRSLGVNLIYAVALASTLNWGMRCAVSYMVMLSISRDRVPASDV